MLLIGTQQVPDVLEDHAQSLQLEQVGELVDGTLGRHPLFTGVTLVGRHHPGLTSDLRIALDQGRAAAIQQHLNAWQASWSGVCGLHEVLLHHPTVSLAHLLLICQHNAQGKLLCSAVDLKSSNASYVMCDAEEEGEEKLDPFIKTRLNSSSSHTGPIQLRLGTCKLQLFLHTRSTKPIVPGVEPGVGSTTRGQQAPDASPGLNQRVDKQQLYVVPPAVDGAAPHQAVQLPASSTAARPLQGEAALAALEQEADLDSVCGYSSQPAHGSAPTEPPAASVQAPLAPASLTDVSALLASSQPSQPSLPSQPVLYGSRLSALLATPSSSCHSEPPGVSVASCCHHTHQAADQVTLSGQAAASGPHQVCKSPVVPVSVNPGLNWTEAESPRQPEPRHPHVVRDVPGGHPLGQRPDRAHSRDVAAHTDAGQAAGSPVLAEDPVRAPPGEAPQGVLIEQQCRSVVDVGSSPKRDAHTTRIQQPGDEAEATSPARDAAPPAAAAFTPHQAKPSPRIMPPRLRSLFQRPEEEHSGPAHAIDAAATAAVVAEANELDGGGLALPAAQMDAAARQVEDVATTPLPSRPGGGGGVSKVLADVISEAPSPNLLSGWLSRRRMMVGSKAGGTPASVSPPAQDSTVAADARVGKPERDGVPGEAAEVQPTLQTALAQAPQPAGQVELASEVRKSVNLDLSEPGPVQAVMVAATGTGPDPSQLPVLRIHPPDQLHELPATVQVGPTPCVELAVRCTADPGPVNAGGEASAAPGIATSDGIAQSSAPDSGTMAVATTITDATKELEPRHVQLASPPPATSLQPPAGTLQPAAPPTSTMHTPQEVQTAGQDAAAAAADLPAAGIAEATSTGLHGHAITQLRTAPAAQSSGDHLTAQAIAAPMLLPGDTANAVGNKPDMVLEPTHTLLPPSLSQPSMPPPPPPQPTSQPNMVLPSPPILQPAALLFDLDSGSDDEGGEGAVVIPATQADEEADGEDAFLLCPALKLRVAQGAAGAAAQAALNRTQPAAPTASPQDQLTNGSVTACADQQQVAASPDQGAVQELPAAQQLIPGKGGDSPMLMTQDFAMLPLQPRQSKDGNSRTIAAPTGAGLPQFRLPALGTGPVKPAAFFVGSHDCMYDLLGTQAPAGDVLPLEARTVCAGDSAAAPLAPPPTRQHLVGLPPVSCAAAPTHAHHLPPANPCPPSLLNQVLTTMRSSSPGCASAQQDNVTARATLQPPTPAACNPCDELPAAPQAPGKHTEATTAAAAAPGPDEHMPHVITAEPAHGGLAPCPPAQSPHPPILSTSRDDIATAAAAPAVAIKLEPPEVQPAPEVAPLSAGDAGQQQDRAESQEQVSRQAGSGVAHRALDAGIRASLSPAAASQSPARSLPFGIMTQAAAAALSGLAAGSPLAGQASGSPLMNPTQGQGAVLGLVQMHAARAAPFQLPPVLEEADESSTDEIEDVKPRGRGRGKSRGRGRVAGRGRGGVAKPGKGKANKRSKAAGKSDVKAGARGGKKTRQEQVSQEIVQAVQAAVEPLAPSALAQQTTSVQETTMDQPPPAVSMHVDGTAHPGMGSSVEAEVGQAAGGSTLDEVLDDDDPAQALLSSSPGIMFLTKRCRTTGPRRPHTGKQPLPFSPTGSADQQAHGETSLPAAPGHLASHQEPQEQQPAGQEQAAPVELTTAPATGSTGQHKPSQRPLFNPLPLQPTPSHARAGAPTSQLPTSTAVPTAPLTAAVRPDTAQAASQGHPAPTAPFMPPRQAGGRHLVQPVHPQPSTANTATAGGPGLRIPRLQLLPKQVTQVERQPLASNTNGEQGRHTVQPHAQDDQQACPPLPAATSAEGVADGQGTQLQVNQQQHTVPQQVDGTTPGMHQPVPWQQQGVEQQGHKAPLTQPQIAPPAHSLQLLPVDHQKPAVQCAAECQAPAGDLRAVCDPVLSAGEAEALRTAPSVPVHAGSAGRPSHDALRRSGRVSAQRAQSYDSESGLSEEQGETEAPTSSRPARRRRISSSSSAGRPSPSPSAVFSLGQGPEGGPCDDELGKQHVRQTPAAGCDRSAVEATDLLATTPHGSAPAARRRNEPGTSKKPSATAKKTPGLVNKKTPGTAAKPPRPTPSRRSGSGAPQSVRTSPDADDALVAGSDGSRQVEGAQEGKTGSRKRSADSAFGSSTNQVCLMFSSQYKGSQLKELSDKVVQLGGRVLSGSEYDTRCTHLLLPKTGFTRSAKQMQAIAGGAAVVDEQWLEDSFAAGGWVEVRQEHVAADDKALKQWEFDLWSSLQNRKSRGPLLQGVLVHFLSGLKRDAQSGALQKIVVAAGGEVVHKPGSLAAHLKAATASTGQGHVGPPSKRQHVPGQQRGVHPSADQSQQQMDVLVLGVKEDDTRRTGLPSGVKVYDKEMLLKSVLVQEQLWRAAAGMNPIFITKS